MFKFSSDFDDLKDFITKIMSVKIEIYLRDENNFIVGFQMLEVFQYQFEEL